MPSEKILAEKKLAVTELSGRLKKATTGVVVSYKGISVLDDTKLRKEIRTAGGDYTVVKNTLLKLALQDAGIEGLDSVLEGSTALALSEDYVSCAKIPSNYAEKSKTFKVKAGFVEGGAVDADGVKMLASLPSKEVLVAQVLCGFNTPITGFVTVLNGTLKSLVLALNAIAEKQSA